LYTRSPKGSTNATTRDTINIAEDLSTTQIWKINEFNENHETPPKSPIRDRVTFDVELGLTMMMMMLRQGRIYRALKIRGIM